MFSKQYLRLHHCDQALRPNNFNTKFNFPLSIQPLKKPATEG
jgi:hypothetical protein